MVPVHNSLSETLSTRLFFRIQNFSGFWGGYNVVYTAYYVIYAVGLWKHPLFEHITIGTIL